MAVVVFKNGGNLFGAGNGLNALGDNLGTFGAYLQLANTRYIAFTPNANDTLKGVVLAINWVGQTATTIRATLEDNITGSWVAVAGATKTLNGDQITNNLTVDLPINNAGGQFVRFFEFGTPAVVTTAAIRWRFNITTSTASGNPYLLTSDGTNPFYVAVGSTAATYVTNADQFVVVNTPLNINANVTMLGKVNSTRYVAGVIGSAASGVKHATIMLTASDGITITTKGFILLPSHSAVGFGWDAAGVETPLTNLTIDYAAPPAGTANLTGWVSARGDADKASSINKLGFYLSGTVPSVEDTYLTANVAVGATSMEVADVTGWGAGDRLGIGGQTTRGIGDTTLYTVTSTSGKTVNFTPAMNVAGGTRLAGVTCTMTIACPAVITTTRNHNLFFDDEVIFRTTGPLPTGFTAGTKY